MTTESQLHAAHEAGYEANYDGELLSANPHDAGTDEYRAWETGHMQAQSVRREWELCFRERAQQAEWLDGADLA